MSAADNAGAELDGFLAGVADAAASTVSAAAGMLSPPAAAADGRYARRRGSAVLDDVPDAAAAGAGSLKNLANSRRKADKPRKRKRASSELDRASSGDAGKTARGAAAGGVNDAPLLNVVATQNHVDDCSTISVSGGGGGVEAVDSSTGGAATVGAVTAVVGSPLPEDLSTVRAVDVSQSPEPLRTSPQPPHDSDAINQQAWLLANEATSSAGAAAAAVIADYSAAAGVHPASSVHDLEAAMSKHLPSAGSADLVDPYTAGLRPHRSAIQWISTAGGHGSMYPNQRESVIRSNVYSAGGCGATTSAQRQYYPASTADVQNSLLTPPGAAESAFIAAAAAAGGHHAAKTPPSAAALNHAATGYALAGYVGAGDAYAMTPPSSVSPQDALAGAVSQYALDHPVTDAGFYPTAAASQHHPHSQQHLHHHHYHHSQLSAIKPLHYGTGVYEHSMSYHQAAAAAAMAAGYYSSNGGGGLASYSAHYRDAMKHANVSW